MLECRCCGFNSSIEYLDLGDQPLANSYHHGEVLPTYPLKVLLCTNCYLSYLSIVVPPDLMFKNYLYVSGTTQTLKDHWKELAADAVARTGTGKVMDLACNDGANLEPFRDLGCSIFGVDPAENLRELSKARGIDVIVDYWREGLVPDDSFDIITAANVFAHVHDAFLFLTAAKKAIKDSGIIILEFPYCREMLEKNYFDQVYHEHVSYFMCFPLLHLFDRIGIKVNDIILTPIHGGSIRFLLKKTDADHCSKAYELIEEERKAGLLNIDTYHQFARNVAKNKEELLALTDGLRTVAYGASAKLSTLLGYCKSLKPIYVVDDNPLKIGYQTPSLNIPIVYPSELAKESEDLFILLTAWNFAEEIKRKVRAIRGHSRDKFVLYVPDVHIE